MDSDMEIPIKKINVSIERGDEKTDDPQVVMVFENFDGLQVVLSDSTVDDIKKLFDNVFNHITLNQSLIEFDLKNSENDLYNHVAQDILDQLNSEIKESKNNFVSIWELTK